MHSDMSAADERGQSDGSGHLKPQQLLRRPVEHSQYFADGLSGRSPLRRRFSSSISTTKVPMRTNATKQH